jgi:hypothetical protein
MGCRYTFPGPGLQAARLELQRVATVGIFVIQVRQWHLCSCRVRRLSAPGTCAVVRIKCSIQIALIASLPTRQGLNLKRGEAAKALTSWGATLYGIVAILLLTPLLAIPVQVCALDLRSEAPVL